MKSDKNHTLLISLAFIFILVFVYMFDPALVYYYPPCPFRALTGLYCPGCGSLRAVNKILHLEVYEAFKLNPLMVLIIPCLLSKYSFSMLPSYRSTSAIHDLNEGWVLFIIIMFYWLFRNIPLYPFTYLAPH